MTAVARILLDHVHHDFADGNLLLLVRQRNRHPEVLESIDAPFGVGNLLVPGSPGIGDNGRVRTRGVESSVVVFGCPVAARRILAGEDLAEPVPLDIGHVPDQSQE